MFIIKNAFKSITRSKGRNILIGIIIGIIAVSSCVALSIKNSAAEIVKSHKESFALTANIGIDREALGTLAQSQGTDMREIMNSIQTIGIDDINYYGTSSYLNGYTYTLSSSMNSSDIAPLTNDTPVPTGGSNQNNQNFPNIGGGLFTPGDFTILGYSGVAAMSNFVNGTFQITAGAMFEDTDQSAVCVISEELATDNSVTVGDTITLTNPNLETEAYEFTIVGLYEDNTTDDSSSMNWFSNSANQIITNYTALSNIVSISKIASDEAIEEAEIIAAANNTESSATATTLNSQLTSVFYLKDTTSITGFELELKTKGLSEYYAVTTNTAEFDESVKPLTNLDSFATIFLILVLIIGGIILSVLNMINIRERKYEVGVLRAIGMKKGKLAMQFVTELLIVTFVSIIIGSTAGAAASVPTASMLLKSELTSIQSSENQIAENFGRPQFPGGEGMNFGPIGGGGRNQIMGGLFNPGQNVNYVSQINAVINLKVILQLFLIGIILTIISGIISVILISRYEPLKILSNRS